MVRDVKRNQFGALGYPRIAGGGIEPFERGRLRKFPRQRMFTAAGTQ